MIDIVREIDAVQRAVGSGRIAAGEGRTVRLERTYDAPIEDVWDALTDAERISRWFLPISGDYTPRRPIPAGGQRRRRDPRRASRPQRFRVTWVYGEVTSPEQVSELEVRLTAAGTESTTLVLEHTAIVPDEMWAQFGPGAVGVGWDGGLLGLALHLRGEIRRRSSAWQLSEEGREFYALSSAAWGAANVAAGRGSGGSRERGREHHRVLRAGPRGLVLRSVRVDMDPSPWRYSDPSDVTEGGIPMANLVVHFEIHASDPQRLIDFYSELLGWTFSQFGEVPYWSIETGEGAIGNVAGTAGHGINGGLMERRGPKPELGAPVMGCNLVIGVDDVDALMRRGIELGGTEALAAEDMQGVGRVGYLLDPDNNVFGMISAVMSDGTTGMGGGA